ncbi:hypothetical protein CcaverHIS641_0608550 [Cutaneotrichosporon cavernicola]|nr:hypothetical protein CcaverHIS641_0608550 [Cutaneotrichosporon cavernicola]
MLRGSASVACPGTRARASGLSTRIPIPRRRRIDHAYLAARGVHLDLGLNLNLILLSFPSPHSHTPTRWTHHVRLVALVEPTDVADRIAKFENLGGGSSVPAPVPRPLGQGSYARGGLVGNRLPSLDPKTAGLTSTGPRRVSERRDLIGNRVPSVGNANVAAAIAPRSTGGSVGTPPGSATTPTASTPAAASTTALGLGRPGAIKGLKEEEKPKTVSERSTSPTGSAKGGSVKAGSEPGSTAGSVSAASSSVVSAPDSAHSGSAPTSATSSPATSPGGQLPPQLLVSSLPPQDDSRSMTPLSTRAEAGEDAPSEFSMPTTPQAINPELPRPGYDLVPGNLALAAGPQSQAMAPSPSISSSLVSQYDPKSEGEESANLRDVSNVSTPTGTPRQAHKTLDDDVSIAGSVAGSTRGSTRGPEEIEEKVAAVKIEDDEATPKPEIAPIDVSGKEVDEPTTPKEPEVEAEAEPAPASPVLVAPVAVAATVTVPDSASTATVDAVRTGDERTTPRPEEPLKAHVEETPRAKEKKPVSTASAAAGVAASATIAAVAATAVLSKDEPEESTVDPDVTGGSAKAAAEQGVVKLKPAADAPKPKDATRALVSEKNDDAKEEPATVLVPAVPVPEQPVVDVEELTDDVEIEESELDPPKPDNSSEVTAIVPRVESEESSPFLAASGPRDRDITPLGSTLAGLTIDDLPSDRESTPVPDHDDTSQHAPALDDDSDIVSVLGGTMSERDDLASNRSSMPPARASSELEFRYEDLHDRYFRDSQANGDGGATAEDITASPSVVGPVSAQLDGAVAESQEAAKSAAPPEGGLTMAASVADGVSLSAATHSFRENASPSSPGLVDSRRAEGGLMNSFPSVPTNDPDRRPVQVHVEPSPHGVLSQPAVNVQAASPVGATFENGQATSVSNSSSSADTSRVPTPAHPIFPRAPGNDIPDAPTPARGASPSGTPTLNPSASGMMHAFPPVPDEEHPYVEVHVEQHHAHVGPENYRRVPFPRSASERAVRTTGISPPKRTSSLRAPLTPPTQTPFGGRMSPTPGSWSSSNLSVESFDRAPGSRSPGRKRISFSPRSPLLDDEDPGDFEPGEGWAIVNRWEPWRSPSQRSM